MNRNEINNFIIKVFNYYNGKINIVNNKAVLDINWCNLMNCSAGGYTRLPNIVIINPMVIFRFHEEDEYVIKCQIIETIIHELYHIDQIINYPLYASDINYNKFIEHSCQIQTCIYLVGHYQEIYNMFGVNMYIDKDAYNKIINFWWYPGVNYQRKRFHDHIFMCIDNLTDIGSNKGSIVYDEILNTINNKRNIVLFINNKEIPAYINGEPVDINIFNQSIIEYQCTGVYNPKIEVVYDINNNLIIEIEMKPRNLMCKKV